MDDYESMQKYSKNSKEVGKRCPLDKPSSDIPPLSYSFILVFECETNFTLDPRRKLTYLVL